MISVGEWEMYNIHLKYSLERQFYLKAIYHMPVCPSNEEGYWYPGLH